MADIEVLIKIPKAYYELVLERCKDPVLLNAFKSGTPLPKGHGRLYDENELKKEAIRREWSRHMYDTLDHTLSYMKPVIEADRGEE